MTVTESEAQCPDGGSFLLPSTIRQLTGRKCRAAFRGVLLGVSVHRWYLRGPSSICCLDLLPCVTFPFEREEALSKGVRMDRKNASSEGLGHL